MRVIKNIKIQINTQKILSVNECKQNKMKIFIFMMKINSTKIISSYRLLLKYYYTTDTPKNKNYEKRMRFTLDRIYYCTVSRIVAQ